MTLFSWCLHTSSSVLSSLWNTVSLNLRKTLLRVWSPHKIYQTQIEKVVSIYNTCNNKLQERKSQPLSLGESLHQANRGKIKGSYQIFKWGCLGNVLLNCPVLLKNITKTLDTHIFLQSDKHTLSKVKYRHEKNSSIKSKTPCCGKAMCPIKIKQKQTKQNNHLSLVSCWYLADEPPCQWFEAAKLTGDRCVHWQTIGLNYTSQHHRKLTNHCNTHQLRWFGTKAPLCLKNANLIALWRTCANIGCYNHPFL